MQTFLPFASYVASARALDDRRLGKQRVETLQILNSLIDGGGWINHPAVKMWKGYEPSLAYYGLVVCTVWKKRGFNDTCFSKIKRKIHMPTFDLAAADKPPWIGYMPFHISHQSNLIRKNPEFYAPKFKGIADNLPYYWPSKSKLWTQNQKSNPTSGE